MPSPSELHGLLEQVRELTEDVARLEAEKESLEKQLKEQEALAQEHWEKVKSLTRQIDRLLW
jgi:peptidoglycan hydrolase CwlO-like protein